MNIQKCTACNHHIIIRDPDPTDWFCDDDVAIVCRLTHNPTQDLNSKYASDRHPYRSISRSCRPYRVEKEAEVPMWCPLKKGSSKDGLLA